jgi:hypothetical protein
MRVALITANFGGYDPVRDLPEGHGFDDAVYVTNDSSSVGSGWRVHIESLRGSPRLAGKAPKMMPWLYTDCDAAVWLDASFQILDVKFSDWVREHLERDDFVVWAHPEGRVCIRQEANMCWNLPKYKDQPIKNQVRAYLREGFPQRQWRLKGGLFATGTVGYRFTNEVKRFGTLWYAENVNWSIQDQISLPYLLWRENKAFGVWNGNEYNNPYVKVRWDQRLGAPSSPVNGDVYYDSKTGRQYVYYDDYWVKLESTPLLANPPDA